MSGLRIRDLRVELDGRPIIDGLSLDVAFGELLVIAGPSGSGKSTLLRALAGLVPIVSGTIELDGRRVDKLPPGQRGTAMMFQTDALYPHMSVLDNLCFGLRARGMDRATATDKASEVARRLDVDGLLGRQPGTLSGGQRQRVALARALLREPRLFLMDEPLSSLDAPLRVRARAELIRLHRELGSVTIYVTHDQIEAMALADRLGIVDAGRLIQVDAPQAVYRAPASLTVAGFLGAPAINLLRPERRADGCRWQDLRLPLEVPERPHGIVVGLRPEHLYVEGSRWAGNPARALRLPATVEAVELVGDQQYLALRAGTELLTGRCEPDFPIRAGDAVNVSLDFDRALIFDAADGSAL